ncbi:MAG: thioesterase family protein [Bacteroidetes bacterium]|nr:thioesterase family protein [Bacteroidota bacterium]
MRIKLEPPSNILFETQIEILVQHLNYGNHLGNDSLLSILHEARMRFFISIGYTEKDLDGTGVIMTDVAIVYKSEGFHGNILNVKMGVNDMTNKSFDLYYIVFNLTTNQDLAVAKTGILGFDYETRKTKSFSDVFLNKLK